MADRDWLLHRLHPFLDLVGTLSAQLSCVGNTESMLEDLSDLLQCQSGYFGVEKDDQNPNVKLANAPLDTVCKRVLPANKTDSSIESEGSSRSQAFHHRQESRRNDDVAAPAGASQPHSAHRSHLHREEVG